MKKNETLTHKSVFVAVRNHNSEPRYGPCLRSHVPAQGRTACRNDVTPQSSCRSQQVPVQRTAMTLCQPCESPLQGVGPPSKANSRLRAEYRVPGTRVNERGIHAKSDSVRSRVHPRVASLDSRPRVRVPCVPRMTNLHNQTRIGGLMHQQYTDTVSIARTANAGPSSLQCQPLPAITADFLRAENVELRQMGSSQQAEIERLRAALKQITALPQIGGSSAEAAAPTAAMVLPPRLERPQLKAVNAFKQLESIYMPPRKLNSITPHPLTLHDRPIKAAKQQHAPSLLFVSLEQLRACDRWPRSGSTPGFLHPKTREPNANVSVSMSHFDARKTCFVFISHRCEHSSQDTSCVRQAISMSGCGPGRQASHTAIPNYCTGGCVLAPGSRATPTMRPTTS